RPKSPPARYPAAVSLVQHAPASQCPLSAAQASALAASVALPSQSPQPAPPDPQLLRVVQVKKEKAPPAAELAFQPRPQPRPCPIGRQSSLPSGPTLRQAQGALPSYSAPSHS